MVQLSVSAHNVESKARGLVLASRLEQKSDVGLTREQMRVHMKAKLCGESQEWERFDWMLLDEPGVPQRIMRVLAVILNAPVGTLQICFAHSINLLEHATDLGKGRVNAFLEVGNAKLIHICATLSGSRIRFDENIWNQIWARQALNSKVELLGAVDIDFFIKGPGLARVYNVLDVSRPVSAGRDTRERLVQRLEPQLEMDGIGHREALFMDDAVVFARNGYGPGAIEFHERSGM